ncbi:hypothetical protein E2C01_099404 [Portunus trituberculatus]|uniref:Uncharacterized protein n=1 Tax=Portunus trituberculatus TaxID=210409 RepID=A0A5B7K5F0_PORTR|nr:hypothetical protein [Portunus trituberculatus]
MVLEACVRPCSCQHPQDSPL